MERGFEITDSAEGGRKLRVHFRRHNGRVLWLALLTACAVGAVWLFIYAALYWLALVFVSANRGLEAQPPLHFTSHFLVGAGALLLVTWCVRWWRPHEVVSDEKSVWENVMDCVLAIPRATLAIWGNLRAFQYFTTAELTVAAAFLERLRASRGIPFYQLSVEIPDPDLQMKIVLGLQLVELVTTRRRDAEMWLVACRPAAAVGGD